MSNRALHELRQIAREANELTVLIFIALETCNLEPIMALDLTALKALGPRIDAVAAAIAADESGASGATSAADQAALDIAVADLTTRVGNLEKAAGGAGGSPTAITIVPTPATLQNVSLNVPYTPQLSASGPNDTSFTFAVTSGALPSGISMDSTGLFSGTDTSDASGTSFTFGVTATGAQSGAVSAEQSYTITAQ